eukprot:TRINITY_DN7019_c0_g1_i5.p1 TRINITY_DN7019_c0_g1~~TRINITY_DN7019_c0_g1_i5.p1  ORF type:complete len:893 (+),score=224.32 TRINITY_DN7019_c0_g1_i5:59-2737(+)
MSGPSSYLSDYARQRGGKPTQQSPHVLDRMRYMTDRDAYISYLELQLERMSTSSSLVSTLNEKISQMQQHMKQVDDKLAHFTKLHKVSSELVESQDQQFSQIQTMMASQIKEAMSLATKSYTESTSLSERVMLMDERVSNFMREQSLFNARDAEVKSDMDDKTQMLLTRLNKLTRDVSEMAQNQDSDHQLVLTIDHQIVNFQQRSDARLDSIEAFLDETAKQRKEIESSHSKKLKTLEGQLAKLGSEVEALNPSHISFVEKSLSSLESQLNEKSSRANEALRGELIAELQSSRKTIEEKLNRTAEHFGVDLKEAQSLSKKQLESTEERMMKYIEASRTDSKEDILSLRRIIDNIEDTVGVKLMRSVESAKTESREETQSVRRLLESTEATLMERISRTVESGKEELRTEINLAKKSFETRLVEKTKRLSETSKEDVASCNKVILELESSLQKVQMSLSETNGKVEKALSDILRNQSDSSTSLQSLEMRYNSRIDDCQHSISALQGDTESNINKLWETCEAIETQMNQKIDDLSKAWEGKLEDAEDSLAQAIQTEKTERLKSEETDRQNVFAVEKRSSKRLDELTEKMGDIVRLSEQIRAALDRERNERGQALEMMKSSSISNDKRFQTRLEECASKINSLVADHNILVDSVKSQKRDLIQTQEDIQNVSKSLIPLLERKIEEMIKIEKIERLQSEDSLRTISSSLESKLTNKLEDLQALLVKFNREQSQNNAAAKENVDNVVGQLKSVREELFSKVEDVGTQQSNLQNAHLAHLQDLIAAIESRLSVRTDECIRFVEGNSQRLSVLNEKLEESQLLNRREREDRDKAWLSERERVTLNEKRIWQRVDECVSKVNLLISEFNKAQLDIQETQMKSKRMEKLLSEKSIEVKTLT